MPTCIDGPHLLNMTPWRAILHNLSYGHVSLQPYSTYSKVHLTEIKSFDQDESPSLRV